MCMICSLDEKKKIREGFLASKWLRAQLPVLMKMTLFAKEWDFPKWAIDSLNLAILHTDAVWFSNTSTKMQAISLLAEEPQNKADVVNLQPNSPWSYGEYVCSAQDMMLPLGKEPNGLFHVLKPAGLTA